MEIRRKVIQKVIRILAFIRLCCIFGYLPMDLQGVPVNIPVDARKMDRFTVGGMPHSWHHRFCTRVSFSCSRFFPALMRSACSTHLARTQSGEEHSRECQRTAAYNARFQPDGRNKLTTLGRPFSETFHKKVQFIYLHQNQQQTCRNIQKSCEPEMPQKPL